MGMEFFQVSSNAAGASRAARCKYLFEKVSAEFHRAFFNTTTNNYGSGLQTEQAMPLYLGIVPENVKAQVMDNVIKDITEPLLKYHCKQSLRKIMLRMIQKSTSSKN